MSDGKKQLDQMIATLRELEGFADEAAPLCAVIVYKDLERSIRAGEDPYGERWQMTQDGRVPLRNAIKAVNVSPIGGNVFITLGEPEALHHHGAARGKVRRRIIPSKRRLPDRMALEMKAALEARFERIAEGGSHGS